MSNITLNRVLEAVAKDSDSNTDYITKVSNLRAMQDGSIEFVDAKQVAGSGPKDFVFNATDWGFGQLLNKVGMPGSYFKKAAEEDPQLFADHFNHWAVKQDDTRVRLRTKISSQHGLIRGVVSDSYSPMDNQTVVDSLVRVLATKEGEYEVNSFHLDDKRFHLRISYPESTRPVRLLADGTPDYNRVGMDIVNSEVGASSLSLNSLLWRLVCSNGLRAWSVDDTFKQRHIHIDPNTFRHKIAAGIEKTFSAGETMLAQYSDLQNITLPHPNIVIAHLAKDAKFSQTLTDEVLKNFDGDATAFGIVNAFTRAGRDLGNEQRLEVEQFAGRILQFPSKRWVGLANLDELERAV